MAIRTTVALDDDMHLAVKAIADQKQQTIGRVLSDMARTCLGRRPKLKTRNGVPLLPVRNPSAVVTLEIVNRLRDEAP